MEEEAAKELDGSGKALLAHLQPCCAEAMHCNYRVETGEPQRKPPSVSGLGTKPASVPPTWRTLQCGQYAVPGINWRCCCVHCWAAGLRRVVVFGDATAR